MSELLCTNSVTKKYNSLFRFDLALSLGELKIAYELATQSDSEEKWRLLSNVSIYLQSVHIPIKYKIFNSALSYQLTSTI